MEKPFLTNLPKIVKRKIAQHQLRDHCLVSHSVSSLVDLLKLPELNLADPPSVDLFEHVSESDKLLWSLSVEYVAILEHVDEQDATVVVIVEGDVVFVIEQTQPPKLLLCALIQLALDFEAVVGI